MPTKTILVIDRHPSLFEQLIDHPQLDSFACSYAPDLSQNWLTDERTGIVLTNAQFENLSRVAVIQQLVECFPQVSVLVYGTSINPDDLRAMLELGISGCILQNELAQSPSRIFNSVLSGCHVFSISISRLLLLS